MSVIHDPELESLLAGLHARSDDQAAAMRSFDARRTGLPFDGGLEMSVLCRH